MSRKVALVDISFGLLEDVLGFSPHNVEIVHYAPEEPFEKVVRFYLEGEPFPETEEGKLLPQAIPTWERVQLRGEAWEVRLRDWGIEEQEREEVDLSAIVDDVMESFSDKQELREVLGKIDKKAMGQTGWVPKKSAQKKYNEGYEAGVRAVLYALREDPREIDNLEQRYAG